MTTHYDSTTAAKRPQLLKVSDIAQLLNVKPRTIYEMVAQDCILYRICHDLRATFCTRLALGGYHAFTIKAIMGHRDMKTTERYIRANRFDPRSVFSTCPQIGHKTRTATFAGSRK